LNKREDVILLAPAGGIGIELGIAEGEFAERVCSKKHLSKWYGVDMYRGDRNHNDNQMNKMLKRLSKYEEYQFIRSTFEEALNRFEDEYFDIVYVDGYAHTGQEDGKTLDQWYQKVKPGGIISGDDYTDRYKYNKETVNKFLQKNGLSINIIGVGESNTKWSKNPTWWTRKPL